MTDNRTTELLDGLRSVGNLHEFAELFGFNWEDDSDWTWHDVAVKMADELEQAIAATLGNSRAERTCKFVSSKGSDYPPVCSACGYELGIYDCEWFDDGTYGYEPNYCPNCGCKVVSE